MKVFLFIVFIIVFGLFLFLARKNKYNEFHQARISGKIDTVYRYRDYVMIFVKGIEYRIIPVPLGANEFQIDDIVRPRDSLIKSANQDTFAIVRAGYYTRFLYTVKKY